MTNDKTISEHYTHGNLLEAIRASIAKLGKTIDTVTIGELARVDEFHIGGPVATEHLLKQLGFCEQHQILDVGCGLGGAARFAASRYNCQVTGIDLTEEYIETGKALCSWVKLDGKITLRQGSAVSMPFEDESFDGGYMLHVGMNIEDKASLFGEISRVLRPGSPFGIYDVMRTGEGELAYPVPWAGEERASRLATPAEYEQALEAARFEVSRVDSRREFALDFFRKLREKSGAGHAPPPLGLHTLMKASSGIKIRNMIDNVSADYVAPVEIIAHKK